MKKLLTLSLMLFTSVLSFAEQQGLDLEQLQKIAEKAAYSANAINSNIEVSFGVRTEFSIYDILEKNGSHLSYAYMVPGKTLEDTVWDLDKVSEVTNVIVHEHNDGYNTIIVNEAHEDKHGNYREVLRNWKVEPKGCSMYLIDKNWLIGSRECIGTEETGAVGYPNHIYANIPYEITGKTVEGDVYFDLKRDNKFDAKSHIFRGPNVVLAYIGDTPIKEKMAGKPKANVLFFKNNIFSLLADGDVDNEFKIRTSRFLTGAVRSRALEIGSYRDNGTFRLDDSMINLSATGGDPLFYTSPIGSQYLVGFNAGRITPTAPDTGAYWHSDYHGEVINRFYDLHEEDYNFVKKILSQKGDWERVKDHMILL